MNKSINSTIICLLCFVLTVFIILYGQGTMLASYCEGHVGYTSFQISDWLINYEGGFVRRGLLGQILYLLYQHTHLSVANAIVTLYYSSFTIFLALFVYLLVKNGLSVYILPFTICFFYALGGPFLSNRRDYIALLLAFFIFRSYISYLRRPNHRELILFLFLSVATILIHEASFFFTFPILILFSLLRKQPIVKMISIWMPIVATLMFVALWKGNDSISTAIWNSWSDCFQRYPLDGNTSMGEGVVFLKKGLKEALTFHIQSSWTNCFGGVIPSLPFNIYNFLATYYLVTRMNTIDLKWYKLKKIDTILLSNFMILQFVFLIPMFGFLSCDFGRTIPYWVITSLLLYILLGKSNELNTNRLWIKLSGISRSIQTWIDSKPYFKNPYLYLFIISSLPIGYGGGAI